jgi:hypothetical protein
MALATFLVVAMTGHLWWTALMWATRTWLDGLPLPQRIVTFVASGLLAHSALHRVAGHGDAVAQAGTLGAGRPLEWLALGWVCVIALVVVVEALRPRRIDPGSALDIPTETPAG